MCCKVLFNDDDSNKLEQRLSCLSSCLFTLFAILSDVVYSLNVFIGNHLSLGTSLFYFLVFDLHEDLKAGFIL